MTAPRRLSGLGLIFGDVEAGDWFDTPRRVVSVGDIDRFAELTGDRFEIHMNEESARALGFGGRVAHGLLVLSVIDGLKNNSDAGFAAIASLGWNWRFDLPVLAGDSVRARISVLSKRATRHADRGILELEFDVRNQEDRTVQSGRNLLMVRR
jgi:3-hydroxybutyryl-CoA dehydratase